LYTKFYTMSIQERLQMVIKMHNLNASSFAEKIGVQRSNVSHILSGRNNPSLDFIQKTLKAFPRVNGDWLVSGRRVENSLPTAVDKTPKTNAEHQEKIQEEKQQKVVKPLNKAESTVLKPKKIEKIIVFYSDGTFEETIPKT